MKSRRKPSPPFSPMDIDWDSSKIGAAQISRPMIKMPFLFFKDPVPNHRINGYVSIGKSSPVTNAYGGALSGSNFFFLSHSSIIVGSGVLLNGKI